MVSYFFLTLSPPKTIIVLFLKNSIETSINNEELNQYPVSNESSPNNYAAKFKNATNNESSNADITQYSIHDEGDSSVLLDHGI